MNCYFNLRKYLSINQLKIICKIWIRLKWPKIYIYTIKKIVNNLAMNEFISMFKIINFKSFSQNGIYLWPFLRE